MKTCFKCGITQPPESFYKHPRMADGRLNKCIACAKSDVSARIVIKTADPVWLDGERERCRIKQNRARVEGRAAPGTKETQDRWLQRNRFKKRAQRKAFRAKKKGAIPNCGKCQQCGAEGRLEMHHADYSRPLDVQFLCCKCHGATRRKRSTEMTTK